MKSRHKKKGFTLLETLVALSVLTFAVVGPLTLAFYSIRSAGLSQNQLTAFYLAQEALEYVKNQRDNNILANPPSAGGWLDKISRCENPRGCTVDIPYNDIQTCPAATGCLKLRYSGDTGFYHQNISFGAESLFTRIIKFVVVSSYEEKVSVTISWTERFGTKFFTLEENIFNWP